MKTIKIKDEFGFYRINVNDHVEKVNPIDYYKRAYLLGRATMYSDYFKVLPPGITVDQAPELFIEMAAIKGREFFGRLESMELKEELRKLLKTKKKRVQEQLLKGLSITTDDLFVFKAYSEFGYLYSTYYFETIPKDLEGKKLPQFFGLKEDGTIEKIGETNCTDGELRTIIMNRTVIIPKFLEKEDLWHCFLATYKSLDGRESWGNGQPHFHYISSSFNLTKEECINSMKNGTYKASSIHIAFIGD